MRNIAKEYNDLLAAEKINIYNFHDRRDRSTIASLMVENWGRDQIFGLIKKTSYNLRNKTKEYVDRYLNHLAEHIQTREKEGNIFEAYKRIFPEVIRETTYFNMKQDIKICTELAKNNWRAEEIQSVLLENSPTLKNLKEKDKNSQFVKDYVDHVLEGVGDANLNKKLNKVYELAKAKYQEQAQLIKVKFHDKYTAYQDGKVVIDLMVNHGYPKEVLQEVVSKHTLCKTAFHPNYETGLIQKCAAVKEAYQQISAIDPRYAKTTADIYRVYAKAYLDKTHATLLNGKDDQKIAARMLTKGLDAQQVNAALHEASPVAIEPGREKDRYIGSIITIVLEERNKKIAYLQDKYPETQAMYEEEVNKIAADLEKKSKVYNQDINRNRSYYDGVVVRRMIEAKQPINNIVKAIAEKSPKAQEKSERNPNKTPEGYAKWIAFSVKKQMDKEKEIVNYTPILPYEKMEKMSYRELYDAGIKMPDIYKSAIKQRVEQYPNTALNLSQPYIDRDVSEKIIARFGRGVEDSLKQTLHEVSPRAQMPGIPADYPSLVLESVKERMAQVEKAQNRVNEMRTQYYKECGLANEGVETSEHNAYHDGRAAIKMLQDGMHFTDVRNIIAKEMLSQGKADPDRYAQMIVTRADMVLKRTDDIKNYVPHNNGDIVDAYRKELRAKFEEKKYISSRMDISVATTLAAKGYKMSDINEVIKEYSPVAVEPGRGQQYPDYAIGKAQAQLAKEREDVEAYRPTPRLNKEAEPEKEYEAHLKFYKMRFHLPMTSRIDEKIVGAMLTQGYQPADLIKVLDKYNHPYRTEIDHGKQIVQKAMKERDQREQSQSLSPELKR